MKIASAIEKEYRKRAETANPTMISSLFSFLKALPELSLNKRMYGTSIHHHLWRSEYPELQRHNWNKIRVSKTDHIAIHALLVACFPDNLKLRRSLLIVSRKCPANWIPPKKILDRIETLKTVPVNKWTVKEESIKAGVSVKTFRKYLINAGIPPPGRGWARKLTVGARLGRRILELYPEYSPRRIAKMTGLGWWTIRRVLLEHKNSGYPQSPWEPTTAQLQEILFLRFVKGLPFREIGKIFGLGDKPIKRVLRNIDAKTEKVFSHRKERYNAIAVSRKRR